MFEVTVKPITHYEVRAGDGTLLGVFKKESEWHGLGRFVQCQRKFSPLGFESHESLILQLPGNFERIAAQTGLADEMKCGVVSGSVVMVSRVSQHLPKRKAKVCGEDPFGEGTGTTTTTLETEGSQ